MPGYTEPVQVYSYADTQVEATAAILVQDTRAGEAATAALQGIRCPTGAQVEGFGVTITEALTNANATHCIVTCQAIAYEGQSAAAVDTLTLPMDSTEADTTTNKTFPDAETGTTAVAIGARLYNPTLYQVPPGGVVYLQVTQAAGAAGGAFRAFLVLRHNSALPGATGNSPVTIINE